MPIQYFTTETPYLSITLPMFRAKCTGWIALESLARQKRPNIPWELIIAEELEDETFGYSKISTYFGRLKAKRCVKVTYIPLNIWIPLSVKLALLVNHADPKSEVFVFHAVDYYSNSKRLCDTIEAFKDPHVYWLIPPKVLKYHVRYLDRIILVDKSQTVRRDDTPGKAIRAFYVREAFKSMSRLCKGVDGEVYNVIKKKVGSSFSFTVLENVSWKKNLSVEGTGILSDRVVSALFRKPHRWSGAYSLYEKKLNNIVPQKIVKDLREIYIQNKNCSKELPYAYKS